MNRDEYKRNQKIKEYNTQLQYQVSVMVAKGDVLYIRQSLFSTRIVMAVLLLHLFVICSVTSADLVKEKKDQSIIVFPITFLYGHNFNLSENLS